MSAAQPTKGTEIAAIEAARNELQVRAQGSLVGERRTSIARLVMIAMFAIIANAGGHTDLVQTAVGATYTVFGLVTT